MIYTDLVYAVGIAMQRVLMIHYWCWIEAFQYP